MENEILLYPNKKGLEGVISLTRTRPLIALALNRCTGQEGPTRCRPGWTRLLASIITNWVFYRSRDIIFSIKFSRYHFSDKILEISLVFTHGITPAWVNHNRCSVKKCIFMFRAMHENLACNYITQITSRKWHFFDTTILTWPRKSLAKVNTIILISRCKRLSTCPKSRVAHTHSVSQNLTHTSYVTPT